MAKKLNPVTETEAQNEVENEIFGEVDTPVNTDIDESVENEHTTEESAETETPVAAAEPPSPTPYSGGCYKLIDGVAVKA